MEAKLIFSTNIANADQLEIHLLCCNNKFVPKLSTKVNIKQYAQKLREKAMSFECWDNNKLIGFIGIYFNQKELGVAFISNLSVYESYSGKGIASQLLTNCIDYATLSGFKQIQLEVNSNNLVALNFYKKHKFVHLYSIQEAQFLSYQIINK